MPATASDPVACFGAGLWGEEQGRPGPQGSPEQGTCCEDSDVLPVQLLVDGRHLTGCRRNAASTDRDLALEDAGASRSSAERGRTFGGDSGTS
jgi:hypothetical protein